MNSIRLCKSAEYPKQSLLHELVADQAARSGERIAVASDQGAVSYAQLLTQSAQLAHYLISQGVQPGDLVGICVERTADAVIALLGVLQAGAGYVPLDPEYPAERLRYMVDDAGLRLVVSHESLSDLTSSFGSPVLTIDGNRDAIGSQLQTPPSVTLDPSTALAYVIYTSGSTGQPKGVRVQHQAVVNFLCSMQVEPGMTPDDVVLAMTTLSFDISVMEIFLPLIGGASLVMVDRNVARDGPKLIEVLDQHQVTIMQATPSTWRFVLEAGWQGGGREFKILSGGEPLSADLVHPLFDRCDKLWNLYGPTETTVWSTAYQITDPAAKILVGKPINNTSLLILNERNHPVGAGVEGELLIGGDGVTLGYHQRPELTAEKFIEIDGERYYRTGDLAKFTSDGNVECLGRIDSQIKLHGHRIELGEIDAALSKHPSIQRAATTVREDQPDDRRLVSYVIPVNGQQIERLVVLEFLSHSLPDYMLPSVLVTVDSFPCTPNGKLDRNALPKPSTERPKIGVEYVAPRTEEEIEIAAIWSRVLQIDRVGVNDNFFQLGGNSILAMQLISQLQQRLNLRLAAAEFFDRPTICGQMKTKLATDERSAPERPRETVADTKRRDNYEIAIVGVAARFPGSINVRQYWDNLCQGVESISVFAKDDLDPSLDPAVTGDTDYVPARGIVEDADQFDAEFFGISAREAELIDPQQRVLLELAWWALEDAGCVPQHFPGTIGVWAGTYQNTYCTKNLLTNPEIVERTGEFQLGVYNEKDYIAARIAHKLNLTGPAVNVNTACSTSLVAVIEACNSLALGHCDLALAGGVSITFPQCSGHLFQTGNILSPDGHCRPFDQAAAGTTFGDGAGLVALRRLEDAVKEGDPIYAVIKGTGLNNDGAEKASFTAPSIEGQAKAIAMAHARAGIAAETIGYVEAHGTATPIGDPIEVAALIRAFGASTQKSQFCYVGSVKSNIGHAVAAAGIAGLIKAALALHEEQIPATLHFKQANSQIDFEHSPFRVCDRLTAWPRGEQVRRAGVSSFGVGGTNAHVVLEEAPARPPASEDAALPAELLKLSAKSCTALDRQIEALAHHIEQSEAETLHETAHSLQTGRTEFVHRAYFVARNREEAVSVLKDRPRNKSKVGKTTAAGRQAVFMFPGQGAQYLGMGRDLYRRSQVVRDSLDECDRHLRTQLEVPLLEALFAPKSDDAIARLQDTAMTQPAMFSLSYALACLWQSFGVQPAALVGHSIGEFVAACVAGVMTLPDALRLIAERGRLMGSLPSGSMLSVRSSADVVQPRLEGDLVIASYNSPKLCVVAGPTDQIERLAEQLESEHIAAKKLHTSHAFHSPMMDPVVATFERVVREVTLNAAQLPIYSTVTGQRLSDVEATDPSYWSHQLRQPVQFVGAIQTLWQDAPDSILLELGPRKTLAALAKQVARKNRERIAISTLGDTAENHAEWQATMCALGDLWVAGGVVAWQTLHPARPHKVSLPMYPFDRQRHFVEAGTHVAPKSATPATLATPTERESDGASPPEESETVLSRTPNIIQAIHGVFERTTGYDLSEFDDQATFFEMGLDSLALTQTAAAIKREFSLEVTFRQMLEDTPTVAALGEFIDGRLPSDQFATSDRVAQAACTDVSESTESKVTSSTSDPTKAISDTVDLARFVRMPDTVADAADPNREVIHAQLQIMREQLQVLGMKSASEPEVPELSADTRARDSDACGGPPPAPTHAANESPPKKTFGAGARVNLSADALPNDMQIALDRFIADYSRRTPGSKEYAQRHRQYLADPRTVSGFRPNIKEMTYPIVVNRSKGAYLWDLDGNQYIDVTCGFGSNFLGHSPDFMVEAIERQLHAGYEIGPQHPLTGEVARLFCEVTGAERVAFCNTGSEAVLGALRLARNATGRDKFVMFSGDYHGIVDEVIVRCNRQGQSFPAASGIPRANVQNAIVLESGSDKSLRYIEQHLDELAAVLVEPVQSRRPGFQPAEFLQALGQLVVPADTALIFDEVISGFRICPGGAQEHFGVKADLGTYGKVVGGGMPIGAIAGKARYMDGLDGGFWQFGDDSRPEAGMTYFAGTFVRHPLALAAAQEILTRIKREGRAIYDRVNALTGRMTQELNDLFGKLRAPIQVTHFGSLFKVQFQADLAWGELLFAALRYRGVHIWDHRPCLLTISHQDSDVDAIVQAFRDSLVELQRDGFMPREVEPSAADDRHAAPHAVVDASAARVPDSSAVGAEAVKPKLGRDRDGQPAWFIPDVDNPGQFLQTQRPREI